MGPSGGGVDMPPDLMSLFRPGPGVNMVEALNNAQQVLEVLVKAEQTAAVEVGGCALFLVVASVAQVPWVAAQA